MKKIILIAIFLFSISCTEKQEVFEISSPDFKNGQDLTKKFEFNKFGCNGENFAPTLSWKNAPKNTESFALMVYDPDAPTGSGWWHFAAYNIDKKTSQIKNFKLSKAAKILNNDAGFKGYMGPCPPKNHGRHHYVFTIFALDKKLDLDKNASPALLGFMINSHKIESASIMGIYQR